MNHFIDKCCSQCWHTPETPCDLFISCCLKGPLCHQSAGCTERINSFNDKLSFKKHELPVIFIGKGTCGLASGASKVEEAIINELTRLTITAEIIPVGCIGYCAKEVIVDIKLPGKDRVSYCEITPKLVPKLLQRTLVEKKIFHENFLGKFGDPDDSLILVKDIPFFKKQMKIVLANCGIIDPTSIDSYINGGGFRGLDKVLRLMSPDEVINEVKLGGLRGRGGAGFPTAKKWELARARESDQKYLICNADEGDPGAFMDRSVLESDPFRIVEGMLIAAYAVGASKGYIYCRAEYPLAIERLEI